MITGNISEKMEGLRVYEVGYLLLPILDEEKAQKEAEKIKNVIEKNKGMFLSEGAPQKRVLAYPMTKKIASENKKFNDAFFGWIKFESEVNVLDLLKKELDGAGNVLRYLIIKTNKDIAPVSNPVKFAFSKEDSKKEGKEEAIEKSEVQVEEEAEEEKKLDETIDDLVIE